MSITASLSSREREGYDIPVCTQNIFANVIAPVANRAGLELVSSWATFAEITSANLDEFITQIDTLIYEITRSDKYDEAIRVHVGSRLDNLKAHVLQVAGSDSDFEVLIG